MRNVIRWTLLLTAACLALGADRSPTVTPAERYRRIVPVWIGHEVHYGINGVVFNGDHVVVCLRWQHEGVYFYTFIVCSRPQAWLCAGIIDGMDVIRFPIDPPIQVRGIRPVPVGWFEGCDLSGFADAMTGPREWSEEVCAFDFDGDGDVDLRDFAYAQELVSVRYSIEALCKQMGCPLVDMMEPR